MNGEKEGSPKTGYAPPQRFLARVDPIYLFLAMTAVLAFVCIVALIKSGFNELFAGFLAGVMTSVLVGLTFYIWKKKELGGVM